MKLAPSLAGAHSFFVSTLICSRLLSKQSNADFESAQDKEMSADVEDGQTQDLVTQKELGCADKETQEELGCVNEKTKVSEQPCPLLVNIFTNYTF